MVKIATIYTKRAFHYDDFKIVRSLSKKIKLAYLAYNEDQVDQVFRNPEPGNRTQLFVYHWLLYDSNIIERAHKVGVPVIAWTVDHLRDRDALIRLGVDGIITDDVRHIGTHN